MTTKKSSARNAEILFDVGDTITVKVTREIIDASTPCDKGACMVTLAVDDWLDQRFGKHNHYTKTTNTGVRFTEGGHVYKATVVEKTGKTIFGYDRVYRQTCDIEASRASVKPFPAKLVIFSRKKASPPTTKERRMQIQAAARLRRAKNKAAGIEEKTYDRPEGRQLSI